jgi:hypothetical protein
MVCEKLDLRFTDCAINTVHGIPQIAHGTAYLVSHVNSNHR